MVQSFSRNRLCLHYPLLFPTLSFPFKFNNLPAVCFSRDSPAPLAHRQTAESVGNLTQHKLHCEAEVSESVGCIIADRETMKTWKPFIYSHFKGCGVQHMCLTRAWWVRYGCVGCSHSKNTPPQKKLSIASVAYLGIVYVRMDYTEPLAGLARSENPKYYGKYEERITVTQLDLFCVRWIKGNQKAFD